MINTARLVCMLMVASAASRGHQMMKMPVELLIISSSLRFPGKTWTSIAILCNPQMELHRDLMNLKGHMNYAITLGSFSGGRIWVEDKNGDASEKVEMKNKNASSYRNLA